MKRIHIGIAGWSYADWRDRVYPASCRDPLAFCARYVPLLEVNTTFYGTPAPRTVAGWVERTRASGTLFTAKLGQTFTHQRRLTAAEVDAFRASLEPLRASGRLRALLAQFSFAFRDDAAARGHLARLAAAFAGLAPLAVEVRHASWQTGDALAFLAELGVTLVHLDYPVGRDGFAPSQPAAATQGVESSLPRRPEGAAGDVVSGGGPQPRGLPRPRAAAEFARHATIRAVGDPEHPGVQAAGLAYFRLHGRNARAWFDRDAGRDQVYDWLYSDAEVAEIVRRLHTIASTAEETLVVANNHFQGKAMKLALDLAAAEAGAAVEVPELLLRTYPDLAAIARRGQGSLFS